MHPVLTLGLPFLAMTVRDVANLTEDPRPGHEVRMSASINKLSTRDR